MLELADHKWYITCVCVCCCLGVSAIASRSCTTNLSEEEADSLSFSQMVIKFAEKVKYIV